MLTFKSLEEAVEVRTWAGGNQPKVIIINHEDFERIRIDLSRDPKNVAIVGLPLVVKTVPVFGSWQVHKNSIKVI